MPSRIAVDLSHGSSSTLAPVGGSCSNSSKSSSPLPPTTLSSPISSSSSLAATQHQQQQQHIDSDVVNTKATHLPTNSAFLDTHKQQQTTLNSQQPYAKDKSRQTAASSSTVDDTDMDVDSNNDSEDNGAETDTTSASHSHSPQPQHAAYFCFGDRCYPTDLDPAPPHGSAATVDTSKGKGKMPPAIQTAAVSPHSPSLTSPARSTDTYSNASSSPSMTSLVSIDEAEDEADSDDYSHSNDAKGKGKDKGKGSGVHEGEASASIEEPPAYSSSLSSIQVTLPAKSTSTLASSSSPSSSTSSLSTPTHTALSGSSAPRMVSQEPGSASTVPLGSSSSSGKRPLVASHPRMASVQYTPYSNGSSSSASGSGSSSAAGSSSKAGCSSKPSLARATTSPPAVHQAYFQSSLSSSSSAPLSVPMPVDAKQSERTFTQEDLIAYEDLPKDFDFGGGLPFYDIDPRTGVIYGDPHAVMRQYLAPDAYFDQYRFVHDDTDPKKINIYNKHGALTYYYPGRVVGNEQDSIRTLSVAGPLWTVNGRISTWNTLTATEPSSHRQIRILMEGGGKKRSSKKEAAAAAAAAVGADVQTRFVFRFKESDCVIEYRKHKDQYRITISEMCGGESKWKPPVALRPVQAFHGEGIDGGHALAQANAQCGTPSPFDPTRYLQRLAEYRLHSGPVRKEGVFELYNPDTMPVELRTLLMLVSLVVLEIVRPVDERAMIKEFPNLIMANRHRMAVAGGLRTNRNHAAVAMASVGTPGMTATVFQPGDLPDPIHTAPSDAAFCRPPPDYFTSPPTSVSASASASTKSLPNTEASDNSATSPPLPKSVTVQAAATAPAQKPASKKKWGFFRKK